MPPIARRAITSDAAANRDAAFDVAATVRTPRPPTPSSSRTARSTGSAWRAGSSAWTATRSSSPMKWWAISLNRVSNELSASGYKASTRRIPRGEEIKTLGTVELLYDWLIGERLERSDFVVCVGGGVVTDLGGFAAATCLRGIDFIHVPTSLLGMVDASIGGKTGVDHARGKNLIGAFAQPSAVIIDPRVLASLPDRHLGNGWAEVIKHGFILDKELIA